MKTINAINTLLRDYGLRVDRIAARTESDFKKEEKVAQDDILGKFQMLRQVFPELVQVNYDSSVSEEETARTLQNLRHRVENKFVSELLFTGESVKRTVFGTDFHVPYFTEWQSGSSPANFVISYKKSTLPQVQKALNTLVGNMLISLPIKAVHLNFVDLAFTRMTSLFTANLDESLYEVIPDAQKLDELCKRMQDRMVASLKYGEIPQYNKEHKAIKYPYEVIVLTDYPNMYDYVSDQLASLFKNGYGGGIYFVVLHNTEAQSSSSKASLISFKDCYKQIDLDNVTSGNDGLVYVTPVWDNKKVSNAIFNYINEEAKREPEKVVVKPDYEELYKTQYKETDSVIEVPVGQTSSGKIIPFRMDSIQHIHSFIIGQTRSGKSVFLHGIIMGAMLKYAPEDLELYLLDFKTAGVEFARYRNVKHVKALLMNNSDVQIVLEILNELKESMTRRGKELVAAGVTNIADYNKKNPGNRMPQVMVVVDECHVMFNPGNGKNRRQFNEIASIITYIAREGGNQGVHLVLATQTLANTDISSDILNSITDHCLLRCAAGDSERLVRDSSNKTSSLLQGQVYYYHTHSASEETFQSYYTPEFQDVVDMIVTKAQKSKSNGQYCFNGTQVFTIDRNLIESLPAKRNIIASLGYSINLKRESINIPLKQDDGENILFFGINDELQVTRTVMNAMVTSIMTARKLGKPKVVKVMDLLGFEDAAYMDELDYMKEKGLIDLVNKRDCGRVLYDLAKSVQSESVDSTLLVILGQERMRGLKLDMEIEGVEEEKTDDKFAGGLENFSFDAAPSSNKKLNTYRKAYDYILNNGARLGVNVLVQVDQPGKLYYGDTTYAKDIFARFNHVVMLRSDEKAANCLQLSDEIRLENLSSEPERLRAYYYSVESDTYQLFTPYVKVANDVYE